MSNISVAVQMWVECSQLAALHVRYKQISAEAQAISSSDPVSSCGMQVVTVKDQAQLQAAVPLPMESLLPCICMRPFASLPQEDAYKQTWAQLQGCT